MDSTYGMPYAGKAWTAVKMALFIETQKPGKSLGDKEKGGDLW